MHIGFDDPSKAKGTDEFIQSEFYRVRNEISDTFLELYKNQIKLQMIWSLKLKSLGFSNVKILQGYDELMSELKPGKLYKHFLNM